MKKERNRREVKVRNHPGIYCIETRDESGSWGATGRYRAVRRRSCDGVVKKESGFFEHLNDALDFRQGKSEKGEDPKLSPKLNIVNPDAYTFEKLVADWKVFSSLKIRISSLEFYERCLKHLNSLLQDEVEKISVERIDRLVQGWKDPEYRKPKSRLNFERELDLLKTILNHYKSRKNPAYLVPVFDEHYHAAELREGTRNPVQHATADDFVRFIEALRSQRNSQYGPMALTQFGCTLRIGEVAGLQADDFFFDQGFLIVKRTISWSRNDWSYRVHPVKNSKQRIVTLAGFVMDEMKRYINEVFPKLHSGSDLPFLFQLNGEPITSKTVSYAYERAKIKAGLRHLDFSGTHWVRKSGATIGRDATGDSFAVQQLLHHASLKETEKYTAKKLTHIKKVTDAIDLEFRLAQKSEVQPTPPAAIASIGRGKNGVGQGNQTNSVDRPVPQSPATGVLRDLHLIVSNS